MPANTAVLTAAVELNKTVGLLPTRNNSLGLLCARQMNRAVIANSYFWSEQEVTNCIFPECEFLKWGTQRRRFTVVVEAR